MNAVTFNNVEHIYNEKSPFEIKSLNGVDLQIKKGEIFFICGNTGSGKSTLIKLINRLLIAKTGSIKVLEFDMNTIKKPFELRKKVGMIFQYPDNQIFETRVKKELIYGPEKFGMSKREALVKIKESCVLAGLDYEGFKNRNPFELSGGEKRKVAICSILAYDPEIIIFDEPTAGLDNSSILSLKKMFFKLKEKGKTIIAVSHNIDFISECCDKICLLSGGKVIFSGDFVDTMMRFTNKELEVFGVEKPFIYRLLEKIKFKDKDDFKEKIKNIENLFNV
ncbi:MAG: energy-coupling factor ABC transporter ATP-binding protein [Candidatus Muirbacterium halophilum]|nr:energy-coupling factor ABC transporter ATP-binding protein [Candidatus Muirbacterium halophilum]MCK9475755.1 energy-coupling factor ABC transporter ATP-binding protein [Candidatus Muirbacterium halophilum]